MKWEILIVEKDDFMNMPNGWEPFAVEGEFIYFKRQVKDVILSPGT